MTTLPTLPYLTFTLLTKSKSKEQRVEDASEIVSGKFLIADPHGIRLGPVRGVQAVSRRLVDRVPWLAIDTDEYKLGTNLTLPYSLGPLTFTSTRADSYSPTL